MCTTDLNWNMAQEGALEVVQYGNRLTWRKGIKIWCFVQEKWCDYVSDWQTIATRPQPERKTVNDAVEEFDGKWSEPEDFVCVWNEKQHNFEFWLNNHVPFDYCYQVCTCKEFEACVAAKNNSETHLKATRENLEKIAEGAKGDFVEVDEPEWTHMHGPNICKVIKGPNGS